MSKLTVDDLFQFLAEAAGDSESDLSPGESLDHSFEELGYDSLALMETAALIQRRFGVVLDDEQIMDLRTPRAMIDLVNSTPAERG